VRCMLNEHTFLKGNSKINFYQIFSIAIQLYLQNDKVAFLSHPLGTDLGVRKLMVDCLSITIILFSLALMAEAMQM